MSGRSRSRPSGARATGIARRPRRRAHNLKGIDVRFPLGTFVAVTGVSGSGKSTLVTEILYREIARQLNGARDQPGAHDRLEGIDAIDKIIEIDQSPIGRTPRSNPATYTGLFGPIRELFAGVPEARVRGYKPGRFSFNVKGGRCENCKGDGILKIEMQFLPDVYVPCEVCQGKRYNREALEIHFKGKSIADVLEMTIAEALDFFSAVPSVASKLRVMARSAWATSISASRRRRCRAARRSGSSWRPSCPGARPAGRCTSSTSRRPASTSPTSRSCSRSSTGSSTRATPSSSSSTTWTSSRRPTGSSTSGPAGGFRGGRIVGEGTPEAVARVKGSATGEYLARVLRGEPLIPLSDVTFADEAGRGSRNGGNGAREAIPLPIVASRKRAAARG